jgi:hypothetical protein
MKVIHAKILAANPDLEKIVKTNKKRKGYKDEGYNLPATVCSLVLQEYEARVLEQMYLYCVENELISARLGIAVLCADGIMLEQKHFTGGTEPLLNAFTARIKETLGFDLKFTCKPMDKSYAAILDANQVIDDGTIAAEKFRNADDDNAAANLIIDDLKDTLIAGKNGRLFLKQNHIWICDTKTIDNYLLAFILNNNIRKIKKLKITETQTQTITEPYCENVTEAKHIRDAFMVKKLSSDDIIDIYENFHSTTKDRLCFRDGVLDFKMKKFYKWEEINFEYYSMTMIDYDFADYFDDPDMDLIDELRRKMFVTLFGDDTTRALNFLSRALSGNYEDKTWGTYLGNRDCGKGVLYDALKHAFEGYVNTFELNNILCKRETDTAETSRMLYWLLDLEFTRLAVSQETPTPESKLKANGKMIKKLAGGGDTHVARRNYDRFDTHFKTEATLFIMGNDELKCDIADVKEHQVEFQSVAQFRSAEEIQKMKDEGENELIWRNYNVKDEFIKTNCRTEEWKKAIVYLIYENYIHTSVPVVVKTEDLEDNEKTVIKQILEHYTITQNDYDYVLVEDVNTTLQLCKKKICKELESRGVKKIKSCKRDNTRSKWVYVGLIKNEVEEVEDEG